LSGIAAALDLTGAPIDPLLLPRMAGALAYRGPDASRVWLAGPVGMACCRFRTVPEDDGDEQPLSDPSGRRWIVADARLDNRDDLLAAVAPGGGGDPPSDPALILAAYERWGDDCPSHLVGDFAFAIWDAERQRLFCGRDPLGIRQLVYSQDGPRLLVASTPGAIRRARPEPPRPNDELLTELLGGVFNRWGRETCYRGIYRVPAGHTIAASRELEAPVRYWTPTPDPEARFARDEDYIAYFRHRLLQAVRAQCRATGTVGILGSGGVDSSSIAVVVNARLTAAGGRGAIYSAVFDETPDADEREYLEALASACPQLASVRVPADDCWALREFGEDGGWQLEEPEYDVTRAMLSRPLRQAGADGCRVVLTGMWGDQVLLGGAYSTPYLLPDVALRDLPRELPHFVEWTARPRWWLLAYNLARSATPASVRQQRWRFCSPGGVPAPLVHTRRRPVAPPLPASLRTECSRAVCGELAGPVAAARFVLMDSLAANTGVELRYPYLDRRVVEAALAMPPRLCFRAGMMKYVVREALRGLLPEVIRQRVAGAAFDALWHGGLQQKERPRIESWLETSRLAGHGLVDAGRLRSAWEAYWNDPTPSFIAARHLAFSLAVEAWLRAEEEREPP
jgi:asparagine synthase (glutamine-hydrolysing)